MWLKLWIHPRKTFAELPQGATWPMALLFVLIFGILAALTSLGYIWHFLGKKHVVSSISIAVVVGALIGLAHLFVSAWAFMISGMWLKGKGSYQRVMTAVGFGTYPLIVGEVVAIIALWLPSAAWIQWPLVILSALILIWGFMLLIAMVSEAHDFHFWKSVITLLFVVSLAIEPLFILLTLGMLIRPLLF